MKPVTDALLILNAGSSSLKFSVFLDRGTPELLLRGQIERLRAEPVSDAKAPAGQSSAPPPRFVARDASGSVIGEKEWEPGTALGHQGAIEFLFTWGRDGALGEHRIAGAGHRVVHGGTRFDGP